MRPKFAASLVVLGIGLLPACSSASSSSSSASSTGTTAPSSGTTASTPGSTGPVIGPPTSGSARNPKIRVTPRTGHRHTRFVVSFIAPDQTGQIGGAVRRYQVGANISQRRGCLAAAGNAVSAARAGARVSTRLMATGSRWCLGTYTGKIVETTSPRCEPGKACPAFIGILRVIGTFRFRVEN